jgi:hypothetical protein
MVETQKEQSRERPGLRMTRAKRARVLERSADAPPNSQSFESAVLSQTFDFRFASVEKQTVG